MTHVIETANTGRARCRACKEPIAKGDLRLGQRVPNPFGEGEATYWFHLNCGAAKVPEVCLTALQDLGESSPAAMNHRRVAELASQHARLAELGRIEQAPTGRARCRQCRELIEKGDLRISLDVVDAGVLDPRGFVHARCARDYCETDVLPLLEARGVEMNDETRAVLAG